MIFEIVVAGARHAGVAAMLLTSSVAISQPAAAAPVQVYRAVPRVVVVDRTRPGWWRGRPEFTVYAGPRRGYYFAPGYGYYLPPRGVYGRVWVAGVTLPPPMRRYVVVEPRVYGLRVPPAGYRWYYAGDRIVLAAIATGIILESVPGGW
ncbi:RcnB family protein [Sphingomonas sp. RS6]